LLHSAIALPWYDPDQELIATLLNQQPQKKGKASLVWDGKDEAGSIVPDDAYFFTIKVQTDDGKLEIYDPTVFSGGIEQDLTKAKIDLDSGTITYKLPTLSRVRIRLGINGGPLLKTLVDWQPRPSGQVVDYWKGKDKEGLFELGHHPRFKMIISYFDLPENSVITYGNKKTGYFEYKKGIQRNRKEQHPWRHNKKRSKHFKFSRLQARSPNVMMSFSPQQSEEPTDIIVLKGKTVVHVELEKDSKQHFQNTQFEIVFFLDGQFYAEEEVGYSPYNWIFDTSQVKEGEYVLTVNLSGFQDQMAIFSKKIRIVH
jgi:hypothetical protein